MAAETNTIMRSDLVRVREIDFTLMFSESVRKLVEALGVTRKIAKQAGTVLKTYKATGTLQDGNVAEGELIPLSKYTTEGVDYDTITLKKWRKQTTAEAITDRGYDQAVEMTNDRMLRDVQKGIRTDLFGFLNGELTGAETASGADLQAALADAWGQLQVKFEDDTIEAVYFVNPMDIASYLATAEISTQDAFGMKYVEDFLGLGTVIISSRIAKGTFVATAKENFIAYYLTMNGDIAAAFNLTADETGFIGIKSGYQNEERAQIESLVMSGIQFLVEYAAGVVKGTIGGA
jgi:hypothetical protein